MEAPATTRNLPGHTLFLGLAIVHGVIILAIAPYTLAALVVIALGVWWSSNTIAHNFVHRPFFRRPHWNTLFSFYLSALLGIPQTLWRQRHLAHHADLRWRLKWNLRLAVEIVLVLLLWGALAAWAPNFFFAAYLPGYGVGLALCALHGHQEHAGGTTSHYGTLYNRLFFNDGFHVEHHRRPGLHWSKLPSTRCDDAKSSAWPPVLRGVARWEPQAAVLDGLERLVFSSSWLRGALLRSHERAIRAVLMPGLNDGNGIDSVAIVGGGLFPRTAVILRRLLPRARIVCIDLSRRSLDRAGAVLRQLNVEALHETFDPQRHQGFDLVVIPLAYRGNREGFFRDGLSGRWLIHDWIWRRRGRSAVVSPWLLKRINFVETTAREPACAR